MAIQQVTPANGAAQLPIAWDNGTVLLLAGQVLDVPPGGALEAAIGLSNLTAVTGTGLTDDQQGDGGQATDGS